MKRKLGKTKVNPLDLLLDTTSNVFGSMILIAIMISLFSGNPSADGRAKPGEITSEAIERQIRNAEKDASVLAADLSKLKSRNGEKEGARLLAELENDIDSLKCQLENAKKTQRDGIQASIIDYGASVAGATREAAAIEEESARKKNAIAAEEQQIAMLKDRIDQLQAKVQKERAKKVQRLSLPKEHETDQHAFYVILINDEVFPQCLIDSSGNMIPFPGIKITERGKDEELRIPIRGKGMSFRTSKSDIVELIRRLPRDCYIAALVFPDSIQSFRDFEEVVHGLGREMGWRARDMESELVFSTSGTSPKPQ
jgi:flagellar motor protein MotB